MVEQGAKDAADLEEIGDSGGFFYLTPILKMALLCAEKLPFIELSHTYPEHENSNLVA